MKDNKGTQALMKLTEAMEEMIAADLGWTAEKCHEWMITSNPNFGNIPPMTLILLGRSHKVLSFIVTALSENKPNE